MPNLTTRVGYWELSVQVTEAGRYVVIEYTRADRSTYRARIADNGDLLHPSLANVPANVRTAAKRLAKRYLATIVTE